MFWKKRPPKVPITPQENRIDVLANRLQKEGKIHLLEEELLQFTPGALSDREREAWHELYGIVAFRAGDRDLAFQRFQDGVRSCPDAKRLKFSLGQEYEFRGDIENMLSCFDEAKFPDVPSSHALAETRYAYLWGRLDQGAAYLRPIIPAYFQLKILDDHFLYVRGLPFFGQTWAYFAAFAQLTGDYGELQRLTDKAKAECSDYDFASLAVEFEAIRSGNFGNLKEKLRNAVEQAEKSNWPAGYQRMRFAVLEAQEATSLSEATQILDSVRLAENDFRWLADIRLLAMCELAKQHGSQDREAELIAEFIARQPMLFEPDNAVNFNLLRYQETLKGHYMANRSGRKR